jgi:2,5-furandicarboxylate decarboxylase 1
MSFRDFVANHEKSKQVLHVPDKLSRRFEVSYVMNAFGSDDGGPILAFDNVEGFEGSIVANVCGSRERIRDAIGADKRGLYQWLTEAWRSPVKPKIVHDGNVSEVEEKTVDLSKIPVLTHFEKDSGPYITSGVVHAKSPDGKIENVSIHRLKILDKQHLAIRLVPRHLFELHKMAKSAGKDLDVAISIGVHPTVLLAASSPLPFGICEFDAANSLLNNSLHLVKCSRVDAHCPGDSELVLEGRISSEKEVAEGPFVDITGTYDIQRRQPVVEIVNVMHRRDYLYHALLPSGAEHRLLMGLPHEALIWEAVGKVVPRVGAVNLTRGGCGWLDAVIAVEKQVEGDGKNAILAAFASHPSLKHTVVVDLDVNVFDPYDVEWAVATRFQATEDLVVVPNVRGSTLDSSANQETGLTSKMGIDATRPLSKPREKFERAHIHVNDRVAKTIERMRGCA